jgi:arsenate reductase (thioredoxin)
MKILFICTHNRCRSILSEAITNQLGNGLIVAKSAGSQPAGEVHPLSLKYLKRSGYSVDDLKSQSWHDFADFHPALVITVCDSAAGETCPVYFGNSIRVHWGLSDPSKMQGDEFAIEQAFTQCMNQITERANGLIHIAKLGLSKDALKSALQTLGAH